MVSAHKTTLDNELLCFGFLFCFYKFMEGTLIATNKNLQFKKNLTFGFCLNNI